MYLADVAFAQQLKKYVLLADSKMGSSEILTTFKRRGKYEKNITENILGVKS